MRVATANVKVGLGATKSATCLTRMLAADPQVLALIEWGWRRRTVFGKHATAYRFPRLRKAFRFTHPTSGYVYTYPLIGGIPAVVDASWGEIVGCRKVPSSTKHGRVGGRTATELIVRRRSDGVPVAFRLVHLHAHHDDPNHLAAWREGKDASTEWARSWGGFPRFVLGDMNKPLYRLPGLVSCWLRRDKVATGPHGGTIDHVYAPVPADRVVAVRIPSDHPVGVVADYTE